MFGRMVDIEQHGVAGIYLPSIAPTYYKAIQDKDPGVTTIATELMKKLAVGTADETSFTAKGRKSFFPEKAKMFESYLKPIGEPTKVQLVERSDTPAGKLYRWEFFYKNVILLVSITLANDGKIVSFESFDNY